MIKRFLVFSFVFLSMAVSASANNLVISNVTLEDRNASANTMVVQFDISWDHSWRKNDGRHDAAWVFVKISNTVDFPIALPEEYVHGLLYTAGTNPAGTSPGTNSDLKIVIPSDKIGAFISRQATGNGTFSSKKVRLTVDYGSSGVGNTSTIQVKVFGIEMVYIPEGPFYVGDGNGSQESSYAFHQNGADNTAVQITTAGKSITVDSNASDDIDTSPITVTGLSGIAGNTSWPNGYSAFYLMKYELTQGQYVDFLNTLTRVQQGQRVGTTVSGNTIANFYVMIPDVLAIDRQSIRAPESGNGTSPTRVVFGMDYNGNGTFNELDDGENIAMNYVNWMDLAAYADWAGLRPYTEMEYEKACRGPNNAVYQEYSWGSTRASVNFTITEEGLATEKASTKGEGLSNLNILGGPYRSGFAATTATNRLSAGAGYYGNMDLTGNVREQVVNLGKSNGRSFSGTHGDGVLTTTSSYEGNATNTDWPGIDATTARGVTGSTGSGYRGMDWNTGAGDANRLSSRQNSASGDSVRYGEYAIRLARTAP